MTIVQKQCLLRYLDYYTGAVDGIWGPESRRAAEAFQRATGSGEAEMESSLLNAVCCGKSDWWQDIRYFAREEFACKCGGDCNGYPGEMDPAVVRIADRARKHFGAAATVVSGLRCQIHNARVGGVANSRHMRGKAIDLRIQGVTAARLLDYLEAEPEIRYAYAINDTNVHLDVE